MAYTGGALKGSVLWARRAGWAFVVVDDDSPIWGARGTCREAYPTVLRSELKALLEILRVTLGPIVIFVDSANVVDGMAAGEKWCTHSNRDGADLWKSIWQIMDDLLGLVEVKKVKAHLTFSHVMDGRISWEQWVGNGIADLQAKHACAEAIGLSPIVAVQSAWVRACAFYR